MIFKALCREATMKQRQKWAQHKTAQLSFRRKCALLGVNRSSIYYASVPTESDNVTLMNEISDIYAKRPFQGYKRITDDLQDVGYAINHKKNYRLKQKGSNEPAVFSRDMRRVWHLQQGAGNSRWRELFRCISSRYNWYLFHFMSRCRSFKSPWSDRCRWCVCCWTNIRNFRRKEYYWSWPNCCPLRRWSY